MKMHAVIFLGAEWPLCMFNECVISCAVIIHKLYTKEDYCVTMECLCVFGFEHHVWVAVSSLCGVNLILSILIFKNVI